MTLNRGRVAVFVFDARAQAASVVKSQQTFMTAKIPVGILGATGIVGQRFVQMLEHHPWFEVAWLAASDRSEGRPYADAARWKLKTAIPVRVAEMRVAPAVQRAHPKLSSPRLTPLSPPRWNLASPKPVAR